MMSSPNGLKSTKPRSCDDGHRRLRLLSPLAVSTPALATRSALVVLAVYGLGGIFVPLLLIRMMGTNPTPSTIWMMVAR